MKPVGVSRVRRRVGYVMVSVGVLVVSHALDARAAVTVKNAVVDGSGNGFIRTDFVEVGARPNGSFGSNSAVPDGSWHPNDTGHPSQIGFRADRGGDGWGVGTDDGDFFLPGTPYEGFALQVGSTVAENSHFKSQVVGAFTSASTSGEPRIVWTSSADTAGVSLQQTYSVPSDGSTFLRMSVKLTNNSSSSVEAYYARSVDPDNCRTRTTADCDTNGDGVADSTGLASFGGYATRNVIEAQILSGDSSSTASAAQADGSLLKLTTTDSESVVIAGSLEYGCSIPKTPRAAYELTRTYTFAGGWADGNTCPWANQVGQSKFLDDNIGLIIHRTIPAGASTTFQLRYLLKDLPLVEPTTTTIASTTTVASTTSLNRTTTTVPTGLLAETGVDASHELLPGIALLGIGSVLVLGRRRRSTGS